MTWADGARGAHNFCVAAVLENIHHHRNRTFSYPLASPVPTRKLARFIVDRQGEYYGFLSVCGCKRIRSMCSEDFCVRTGICGCGYHLQATGSGQGFLRSRIPSTPSESPRYFAASMDESIIVGYYTSAEVLSQRKQYLTYL